MLLTLALTSSAIAATKWTIEPDITVTETYTDNPTLSALPTEDDFVTQVTPGIRIEGTGARFKANFRYVPSVIVYSRNSRGNEIHNSLNAFGNLEAIENFFFVDANGIINQVFISPFAPQPAEITTITSNRTETRTFGVSPFVRGQLGGEFLYELRNRRIWTNANNDALADVRSSQWSGRIAGPTRVFGWALEFEDNRINFDNPLTPHGQKSRLYRGRLFLELGTTLRLSLSAGREENDHLLQEERSYDMYGAGVSWKPTARTSVGLDWERRFFGHSNTASFAHRTRLTAWSLVYSRTASNFQQDLSRLSPGNTAALVDQIFAARIPDPLERRAAVEQFIRDSGSPAFLADSLAFYTEQIFLDEHMEGSVAILGKRNSVTLTAFRSERKNLSNNIVSVSDAFFLADRITQHGFGIRLNHQVTAFTTAGVSATTAYTRQEEVPTLASRNDYVNLSLTSVLSRKTNIFGGLSFSRFTSGVPGSVDARSAFVGLNHRF